ncbi:MAG: ABC-2 type transport system permease protein, partial [Mariniblastus sp.]
AYVSSRVPSEFVKLKYDLVNLLREFDVLGGRRVEVSLHQGIEPFSQEAILAEKKYGIRPRKVRSQSRGAVREEDVILGVAFSCGLERVVIPFMPYGMPVEYELMRSINTVSQGDRMTVGVVFTDALVMGATINQNGETVRIPRLRIIAELQKQYNVEFVDASTPISLTNDGESGDSADRRYDVLFVVQPSTLTKLELTHLIDAIQSGQPTAIFEDPLPVSEDFRHVPPTFYPRFLNRNGAEQGNIQDLWDAIDIDVDREKNPGHAADPRQPEYASWLVWQNKTDNPYRRNDLFNQPERLIIHERDILQEPRFSSNHPATMGVDESSGINELYMQFCGYFQSIQKPDLEIEALVNTGISGRVRVPDAIAGRTAAGGGAADRQFTLAAHIRGEDADGTISATKSKQKTDVIYVADIDTLADSYVARRDSPIVDGVEYRYQNLSFVLNVIDSLANEQAYLGLRNRKVRHVTLRKLEETYEKAMQEVFEGDQKLEIEMTTNLAQAENDIREKLRPHEQEIKKMLEKKKANLPYDAVKLAAKQSLFEQQYRDQTRKFQNKKLEYENKRLEAKRAIDLNAETEIQEIQRKFKLAAVVIPPIPPLLVGLIVFTRRRLREREGISKARRLK